MKVKSVLAISVAFGAVIPTSLMAQSAPDAADYSATSDEEIIVTARQREESLKDVPIAVSALSGDFLEEQQVYQVKDVAAYAPGLNINSDSAGRAFVSMRGIGTTLIDSVQPGVGIFIDGIYQPNTSYLNTPLVDIARVEVLRGPQGTLFGNNTLGGAINVITRAPSNDWEGRIAGALAGPDDFASISGSISGPIISDVLQVRLGAAYHRQDNFQRNTFTNDYRNPLTQKTANATIQFTPAEWATFTLNANYDEVFGGSVPYAWATGPRDFTLDVPTNANSYVTIKYKGASLKSEFDVDGINTKITVVGAFNRSDANQVGADADFGPVDFFRGDSNRKLETLTGELRFDTQWSDNISTLIGVFANDAKTRTTGSTTIVPLGLTLPSSGTATNKSKAVFGTIFWAINPTVDLSAGIRYDDQELNASGLLGVDVYKAKEWQPRFTLSKKWTSDFMTYASVARGVRGGGQNDPGALFPIYRGDSVWTYELGTKLSAIDNRFSLDAAIFYNDYKDFIGPNALTPSLISGQPIAVNLNAGDVESYGIEVESSFKITDDWRIYGNATFLHARVTDSQQFLDTIGYAYPGNRILFVPDWNFAAGTSYRLPISEADSLTFDLGIVAKGKRTGGTLDESSIPIMPSYSLVNGSIAFRHNGLEVALFGTNLFNTKYQETYLDKSLLGRAGLPPFLVNNLAIQGQRRRVGLRASFKF